MPTTRNHATLNVGQPYNDAWKWAGGSDRDKYNTIEHTCNAHREWLLQAAKIIVEERSQIKEQGPWDDIDPRTIFMTVAEVAQTYLKNEKWADELFEEYRCWRDGDALYRRKRIRLHRDSPETVVVRESLIDSRYYCEHGRGTHIFYYIPPRAYVAGQSYAKFTLLDNGTVQFLDPPPRRDPNSPAERSSFTYCGQVPRPTKEYTMRLNTLLPQIVDVIVCVIVWEGRNRKLPEAGLSSLSSGHSSSMQALLRVGEFWDIIFGKDKSAPKRVCDHLKENRVLTEAAYLVMKLRTKTLTAVLEANLKIIADMISRTTAIPIEAVAELEGNFVREESFNQLFGRDSTQDWFVWGNQDSTFIVSVSHGAILSGVLGCTLGITLIPTSPMFPDKINKLIPQNIHEHYRQDEFSSDPLSAARSDSVDSVWEAVQGLVRLVPFLSPEFLNPGSRLRSLQPAPGFPLELTSSHTPQVLALPSRDSANQPTAITCSLAESPFPSSDTGAEDSASSTDVDTEPQTPRQTTVTTTQLVDPKAN